MAAIYSCRSPITTFVSVEAFTFFTLRIARIVSRSSPVSLVVFRNPRADLCYQAFVCRYASAVIMNTHIIDVFDEIVFALFKPRNFFSNAVL